MKFPVMGDENYVKRRVGELTKDGKYKALHPPKRVESASLTITPKWVVMVESTNKS